MRTSASTPRPLFFHGREGRGSQGLKARWLAENYDARTPDYHTSELDTALPVARDFLKAEAPSVIVGSSFGGAVLLRLIQEGLWRGPSIFLAQAGGNFGVELVLPPGLRAILIHGDQDEIVALADSEALAASSKTAKLVVIQDGHRLGSIRESGVLQGALAELGVLLGDKIDAGGTPDF
jgi:fermentation-respiration switch protein FrsA (DUF1100 family)